EDFFEQAHADLNVKLAEQVDAAGRSAEMLGRLTYATDLFAEESMLRFARRYLRVLDSVTVDPRVIVGDIEILDPDEGAELLRAAGEAGAPQSAATIDRLFASMAAARPEALAVCDGTS